MNVDTLANVAIASRVLALIFLAAILIGGGLYALIDHIRLERASRRALNRAASTDARARDGAATWDAFPPLEDEDLPPPKPPQRGQPWTKDDVTPGWSQGAVDLLLRPRVDDPRRDEHGKRTSGP